MWGAETRPRRIGSDGGRQTCDPIKGSRVHNTKHNTSRGRPRQAKRLTTTMSVWGRTSLLAAFRRVDIRRGPPHCHGQRQRIDSSAWCPRAAAAMILSGSAVQTKGFACRLWSTTKHYGDSGITVTVHKTSGELNALSP